MTYASLWNCWHLECFISYWIFAHWEQGKSIQYFNKQVWISPKHLRSVVHMQTFPPIIGWSCITLAIYRDKDVVSGSKLLKGQSWSPELIDQKLLWAIRQRLRFSTFLQCVFSNVSFFRGCIITLVAGWKTVWLKDQRQLWPMIKRLRLINSSPVCLLKCLTNCLSQRGCIYNHIGCRMEDSLVKRPDTVVSNDKEAARMIKLVRPRWKRSDLILQVSFHCCGWGVTFCVCFDSFDHRSYHQRISPLCSNHCWVAYNLNNCEERLLIQTLPRF